MKNRIEKVLARLRSGSDQGKVKWSSMEKKDKGKFEIGYRTKKAIGNVEVNGDVVMMQISATDYNRSYLKRKMRKAFLKEDFKRVEFSFTAGEPDSGRIIYSNERVDANEGDQITLDDSFWINGYDDEVLDCNGFPIGSSHEAIYLGVEQKNCLQGSNMDAYSKLQLI